MNEVKTCNHYYIIRTNYCRIRKYRPKNTIHLKILSDEVNIKGHSLLKFFLLLLLWYQIADNLIFIFLETFILENLKLLQSFYFIIGPNMFHLEWRVCCNQPPTERRVRGLLSCILYFGRNRFRKLRQRWKIIRYIAEDLIKDVSSDIRTKC